MPRIKYHIVLPVLLCVGLSVPAGAECWRWEKKEIPGAPQWDVHEVYMVYSEAVEKMALTIYRDNGDLELWTFDGMAWTKEWGALPEIPQGWLGYWGPNGLYFDENLNTLVVLSHFFVYPEVFCDGLHKYVPGQGWRLLKDCFYLYGTRNAVFDTARKRAVIVGGGDRPDGSGAPYTLEFDGANYSLIKNPEDFRFTTGKLGYDPMTRRTVFFGYVEDKPDLGTYEYDGSKWTKIETPIAPPLSVNGIRPPWGFPFVPELSGLVFIPGNQSSKSILWLYKDHNWSIVPTDNPPDGHYEGELAYDPVHKNLILYGGFIAGSEGAVFSNALWMIGKHNHCRPLSRP